MQQIWGCSDYWRIPPPEVNRKPRLTTKEAKNCAVLDAAKTDFEVYKMAKGYYREVLKGIVILLSFLLFWPVLESNLLFL